jgi:predicted dehydrogenase
MQLGVGIIGFGRIGAEHANWLTLAKNARAVATADATPRRRALAESRGLQAYERVEEMIADPEIDAVCVATPTAMHFDHSEAALNAGKHLLIEKPMTLDFEQASELAAHAKKVNKVISVFHCRRWDPDYLTLKSAIAVGTFGKVINVESRLHQWESCVGAAVKEYRPSWRNERSFGGGGLYDWGSHLLDQIWQLMLPAKPVRVFAQLRGNVWTSDCDDFARICIDFDSGAVAMVEVNTTTKRPLPRWHIDGTLGSADSPFNLHFDTEEWAKLTFAPCDGSPPRMIQRAEPGMDSVAFWECFADACLNGAPPPPPVTGESVLTTMRLLDAARTSSAKGVVVDL